ncbi:universal stress protein [Rhodococcus chondri]|uniref:Universal stress protein n=1 Tax=Rhodococcus chondri TaxID=3065941 RepID=A0ABU7JVF0_9NOCA|nr:universal stress protein [Rhodococcus sp. CC-R104]MEE2033267.1 universal stress protein [Rhodococcus sp. CC-R104]
MNTTLLIGFVLAWVATGLITGLWMARRGHSPGWTVIAVILGPLFVPIAYERIERTPRAVASSPIASRRAAGSSSGLHVVVGYDGSTESEHALLAAQRLFGAGGGVLDLVTVVSYDDGAESDSPLVQAAERRLAAATSDTGNLASGYAVLAGPPGPCLLWFATDQQADVLIIGKRGRGLSTRMLGSVAEYLVEHCPAPVLVVDPEAAPTVPEPEPSPVAVRVEPE